MSEVLIAGLMPVRNEDWCFGYTARMALRWVDKLYILVHASGPSTQDIADTVAKEHPERVNTFVDPDPTWNEMEHRQGLLEAARRGGATHIALVDADETLTANLAPEKVRDLVAETPPGACLALPGIHPWHGITQYRYDGPLGGAFSIAFADSPEYCWQARDDGYQHHRRLPRALDQCGWSPLVNGGVMHLQFVRERAVRAKHARSQMVELLRWPHLGADRIRFMYSWWRQPGTRAEPQLIGTVDPSWWDQELMHHLDFSDEGESWYEVEVRKLLEQHGREKFQGLDLFGIGNREAIESQ